MVSTKEKETFKNLIKFIVIVALTFFVFLQITSLLYLFSIKKTTVSYELSKESAPIPAFTTCLPTKSFAKEEVLAKYNVKSLILDPDPEYEFGFFSKFAVITYWNEFDWRSVSLKQLFDEASLYPQEIITACRVGENYNCTENEGINHRWENLLIRGYSCSTLRIWTKVLYGERAEINVNFEYISTKAFYYKVHDTQKSFPRYFSKYRHNEYVDTRTHVYTYTLEKENRLSEDGSSCSADPTLDHIKCQDDCFEKLLLQDNSSCVLPWVMASGRQCSNVDEAVEMVKKEKTLLTIQCDCQQPCMKFRYIPDSENWYLKSAPSLIAFIENKNGITSLEESYMYTFIVLLANCGGSVGVFFSVSLVWLLQKIITTFFNFKCLSQLMSSSFAKDLVKYVLRGSFLACLVLFLYEGSYLIAKYLRHSKIMTVERLDPRLSSSPNLILCTVGSREIPASDLESPDFNLNTYSQLNFRSPIHNMIECRVDNKTCMVDESAFLWETLYTTRYGCSMLRLDDGQYKELEIIFDDENYLLHAFITTSTIIPKYGYLTIYSATLITPNNYLSMVYTSDQKKNLPPCTENYLQCMESCWEDRYAKEDVCSPPELPVELRKKPCTNAEDYLALKGYLTTAYKDHHLCHCDQQCLDVTLAPKTSSGLYAEDKTQLTISLVPVEFTRRTEEWEYPLNSLMAGIGGTLGLFTGLSFLSILLDSLLKILAVQRKASSDILRVENAWKVIVYVTIWSCTLQQVYITVSYYMELPVQLIEEIDKDSVTVLPHFTVCTYQDMFIPWGGYVMGVGEYDYVYPTGDSLIVTDMDSSWFDIQNYLTDCNVLGFSCKEQKGEIHEWHNVTNVNRYCARLEIKPLKLQDVRYNTVTFTASDYLRFYVSNPEIDRLFHLTYAKDIYDRVELYLTMRFTLYRRQYELLEDKPNNCINRLGYNKRNCLDKCVLDYIQETFNCRFPWMNILTKLPICNEVWQYDFIFSINSTFLAGCQCLPSCHYTENYIQYDEMEDESYATGITEITIIESKKISKELWAYTASKLLADLGGLMSFFTGLTLYGVCFSIDSFISKLCKLFSLLKSLKLCRLKVSWR